MIYCCFTNHYEKCLPIKDIQFLNEGKDWEKKATSIPGIFLLRLPGLKSAAPSIG
jgi:hypothetical protein